MGPSAASVSTEHFFKPLPEIFKPLGRFSSMYSTVVPGLFSVTSKLRLVFFGLDFVPAFEGETLALNVEVGSCATAPVATARDADATTAPVSSLRK